MRLFLAIEIPSIVKSQIATYVQKIQRNNPHLKAKWVAPENLHVSLMFLGETPQEKLETLKKAAEKALSQQGIFSLTIEGIGVFPNPRFVRVIWLGISEGQEELKVIYSNFSQELNFEGFSFDQEKDYHPHLTIARVREAVHDIQQLQNFLNEEKPILGSWKATEVVLMESQLGHPHPIYRTLLKFPLREVSA